MNNKDFDRLMEEALHIPIPEGLAGRLEKRIDAYALREKRHKTRRFYGITGLAAVALLCVGIFLQTSLQRRQPADTFTDPAEAAAAAGQVLAFMSEHLNKGMEHVSTAGQEFEKVNEILTKHLK